VAKNTIRPFARLFGRKVDHVHCTWPFKTYLLPNIPPPHPAFIPCVRVFFPLFFISPIRAFGPHSPILAAIFLISFTNSSARTRVFEVGFWFSTLLTCFQPFLEDATIKHCFYATIGHCFNGLGVFKEWGNFECKAAMLLRGTSLYVNLLHRTKFS
jgi:hypothetical protein